MKTKNIPCLFLATVFLLAAFPVLADSTTTEAIQQNYSIGILQAGSYIGYNYEDNMNYTSKAGMEANGIVVSGVTEGYGTLNFSTGKPVMEKQSKLGVFTVAIPAKATDQNGLSLPTGKRTYSEVQYSMSKTSLASVFVTAGATTASGSGQTQYQSGAKNSVGNAFAAQYGTLASGGAEQYATINDFYNANDVISARTLYSLGGTANNKLWTWAWNETKGQEKGAPLFSDQFPRYGQTNTQVGFVKFEMNKDTADGQLKIYSVKVYEEYEMLFKDAITSTEKQILGENQSLSNVTQNLSLPTEVTGLDLNRSASITWSSDNTAAVENDGTVHYEKGIQKLAHLTGVYTIDGKVKTIEYTVTVQNFNGEQVQNAAEKLTWSQLSNQQQDCVTSDLNLPSSILTDSGETVSVTWSVTNGSNNVTIDGEKAVIVLNEQSKVQGGLRASLSYGNASDVLDFAFTMPKGVPFDIDGAGFGNADGTQDYNVIGDIGQSSVLRGSATLRAISSLSAADTSYTARMIIAYYTGSSLQKLYVSDNKTISITQTDFDNQTIKEELLNITIDLSELPGGLQTDSKFRLYIWDTLTGIKPLCDPVLLESGPLS